ncbi:MAG: phage virion morphogenesis protein [Bacteroidota bacterium]
MSEVLGVEQINARLERLLAVGGLSREAYLEMGFIVIGEFQENFRVGGRPTPWPPSIRVQRFGGQTLRHTGRFMRSFTVDANNSGFAVGSNHPGARIHALGGIIRAKNAEFLSFRIAAGLRTTSKSGKQLKTPQKEYGYARVKQVTIPQRDYRFVSPQGIANIGAAAIRHLKVM